jgi:hypothetical protein
VDGQVFARITRRWSIAADRRRLLRFLGASVLATWELRRGPSAVAQMDTGPMTCTQDADCQDGDANPCSGATCLDGLCTFFIVDCIAGTICCGNGACCPDEASDSCTTDTDCAQTRSDPCRETTCVTGTCLSQGVPCPPGQFCHLDSCAPIGPAPIAMP